MGLVVTELREVMATSEPRSLRLVGVVLFREELIQFAGHAVDLSCHDTASE